MAKNVNLRILKLTCVVQNNVDSVFVRLQRFTHCFIENLHRVPLTVTKIRAALMLTVIDDLTKT